MGLKSMRERAALLGGQLIVVSPLSTDSESGASLSATPHGTRVRVII